MSTRNIRCVVACRDASGVPTFYPCVVSVTPQQYEEGKHYDLAIETARDEGYDGEYLAYDENDGPQWLFQNMFGG